MLTQGDSKMIWQRIAVWIGIGIFAFAGCGGPTSPPIPKLNFKGDAIPVSGTIKLNGEPVSGASVMFLFDGKPPEGFVGSTGVTDSSGRYVLRSGEKTGAPAGRYKVVISRMATPDGSPFKEDREKGIDLEQARLSGMIKETIPPKYSDPQRTDLSIELTPDRKDPIDFDLKSK